MEQINLELQKLKRGLKNERRRSGRGGRIPQIVWLTARMIMILGSADTEAAMAYVTMKRSLSQRKKEALRVDLKRDFELEGEALRELVNREERGAPVASAMRQANRFLSEWRVHSWVEKQNVTKSIAPLTNHMIREVQSETLCKATIRRHMFQWVRRWRRRWQMTLGTFSSQEAVDVQSAQRKAGFLMLGMGAVFLERGGCPLAMHPAPKISLPRRRGEKSVATMWPRFRSRALLWT